MRQVRGTISNELFHVTDWLPTIARIAGVATTRNFQLDGHDIWDSLTTGSPSPRTEMLYNINPLCTVGQASPPKAGIRVGKFKLLSWCYNIAGVGNATQTGQLPPRSAAPVLCLPLAPRVAALLPCPARADACPPFRHLGACRLTIPAFRPAAAGPVSGQGEFSNGPLLFDLEVVIALSGRDPPLPAMCVHGARAKYRAIISGTTMASAVVWGGVLRHVCSVGGPNSRTRSRGRAAIRPCCDSIGVPF